MHFSVFEEVNYESEGSVQNSNLVIKVGAIVSEKDASSSDDKANKQVSAFLMTRSPVMEDFMQSYKHCKDGLNGSGSPSL
jgi:hypothetical protein